MITPRQLARRAKYLGASDIPAILGLSEYANGADVQAAKLHGAAPVETEAMRLGSALERSIIEAANLGRVSFRNTERRIADSPILAHLDATVDGVPVEAKLVGSHAAQSWGDSGSHDVPIAVAVQVTTQMASVEADHAYVVALIGSTRLGVYRVPFDAELADYIIRTARSWWELHVVQRAPVQGGLPSMETIRAIKRHEGKSIPLDDAAERIAVELQALRDRRLAAEKDESEARRGLLALLGDAEIGTFPGGGRVEYIDTRPKRIDLEKLRSEYPDVYAACSTIGSSRTLRLKGFDYGGSSLASPRATGSQSAIGGDESRGAAAHPGGLLPGGEGDCEQPALPAGV